MPYGGRVFVTGATGLVGSHVASLLRSEGFRVRALHRSGSDTRYLRSLGCELVEGSLQDADDSFDRLLADCSGVVHSAAVVYSELSWPRIREINVEGTAKVLRAAGGAGVVRAVHLSSVAVYGARDGGIDEHTPLDTPLRPRECYARSKRESERMVREHAWDGDTGVAILRPSVVYGERDRLFAPKIARALRLPLHPMLGGGRSTVPAVYAGNLAHAVLRGLRGPVPAGVRVYNVAEDHPLTQRELFARLAEGLGATFRPVPIPARIAGPVAAFADAVGLRVPGAEELSLRRVVRLAVRPNPYRSDRIRAELGWDPPTRSAEALRRTGRWLARAASEVEPTGGREGERTTPEPAATEGSRGGR